jgi:hypothetical protein
MTDQEQGQFDGETCRGCDAYVAHGEPDDDVPFCVHHRHAWTYDEPWPDVGHTCDCFKPSLQCRQVRADEEANRLRERKAVALEQLASVASTWFKMQLVPRGSA